MTMVESEIDEAGREHFKGPWPQAAPAFWLLAATLALVQFPLGSARPWAWDILILLVALNILLCLRPLLADVDLTLWAVRQISIPALLMLGVLSWIFIQCAAWTPAGWHNAIWQVPAESLGRSAPGAISLSPYTSVTEGMKLLSYLAIGFLAYFLSLRHEYAHRLFVVIFLVGVAYSLYGILLSALGTSQLTLFEGIPPPYHRAVSGGFGAKNSFAAFTGLALLPSMALFVSKGQRQIVTELGYRILVRTVIQYTAGSGALYFTGIIIMVGALIASNSRAGLVATIVALFAMLCLSGILSARKKRLKWTLLGGLFAGSLSFGLFLISGHNLESGFANLVETASLDDMRAVMWNAAIRGILANAILGTGLGTYGVVYHLYADRFVPFVVDRAHNDYLEFTLGVGVPAALVWFAAFGLLALQCLGGVFRRHRRRLYSITAFGCMVLVGFHSIFDFSLQMPAVSVLFATLVGVGLSQSTSSR